MLVRRPLAVFGFLVWISLVTTLSARPAERRGSLPEFDFRTITNATGWSALHDCSLGLPDFERGLPVTLTGADPYFVGPSRDFPPLQPLWMELELFSETGGNGQLFFASGSDGPAEERSVRFVVPAGQWHTARVPLPALRAATRFRLDPPGASGICHVRRLGFTPRILLTAPAWSKPTVPVVTPTAPQVRSGDLEWIQGPRWGEFEVRVAGQRFAIGHNHPLIGYENQNEVRWWPLDQPAEITQDGSALRVVTRAKDPNGADWELTQIVTPGAGPGTLDVETRIVVSADRSVVYLPLLAVHPGVGNFGTNKVQALLAGVEYLENEVSSSERDLIGAQARRQVPDSLKLTFPLMSLAADNRWLGIMWEPSRRVAALHDTPDRIFNSGGSVMAVIYPGSDPRQREDGSILPYEGELLRASEPLTFRATLLGGKGQTVIPSVQAYVARHGLPAKPQPVLDAAAYYDLTVRGWLDSDIRDGNRFRHAVGPTFSSQPAVDAAWNLDWLADHLPEGPLADRARTQAAAALTEVPLAQRASAMVGHVRYPVAPLVYGGVEEAVATARAEGRSLLSRFHPDGSLPYAAPAGGPDFSSTHWSKEANGLAATSVTQILERGLFGGDRDLIREGLRLLRALDRFRNTVPRGAQTWEVPLHTPDILASAYLVRAYTLGFELTGEADFLQQALYWAWTGVPFVYLQASTTPVGAYATTPVLGATQWIAPNWIGLPVQWCGLVYAEAIRPLAFHDPSGPWIPLADGIAQSGVQQTHPATEPKFQGLLPDSYDLRAQFRNPVPINPATLFPLAAQSYGAPPLFDFRVFRRQGLWVYAPGPITPGAERSNAVQFRVEGWPKRPHWILIQGLTRRPQVKLNGVEVPLSSPHRWDTAAGRLVLQLERPTEVEVVTLVE
ncbi:MAG: hypothetical protein J0M24_04800 [Verrucomicrobia bacterium]|nr:hypothetical protein [Verrucomicrobiota bacterium]